MNTENYIKENHRQLLKALIVSYKFVQMADKQLGNKEELLICFERFVGNEIDWALSDLIWSSVPGAYRKGVIIDPDALLNIVYLYFDGVISIDQCLEDLDDFIEFGIRKKYT